MTGKDEWRLIHINARPADRFAGAEASGTPGQTPTGTPGASGSTSTSNMGTGMSFGTASTTTTGLTGATGATDPQCPSESERCERGGAPSSQRCCRAGVHDCGERGSKRSQHVGSDLPDTGRREWNGAYGSAAVGRCGIQWRTSRTDARAESGSIRVLSLARRAPRVSRCRDSRDITPRRTNSRSMPTGSWSPSLLRSQERSLTRRREACRTLRFPGRQSMHRGSILPVMALPRKTRRLRRSIRCSPIRPIRWGREWPGDIGGNDLRRDRGGCIEL